MEELSELNINILYLHNAFSGCDIKVLMSEHTSNSIRLL